MFQNSLLRKIFWSKRYDATGLEKKKHNKELHEFYSSQNTIWVIKSRIMLWAWHMSPTRKMRGASWSLVWTTLGKTTLGKVGSGGKDNIKWVLRNKEGA